MFHLLNRKKVKKTKEVTDYRKMQTSELEELQCDYTNEMRQSENEEEREWLSAELDEIQAILDERD